MQFLSMLFNIKIFVGFIQNDVFPTPLSADDEKICIANLQIAELKEEARKDLIEHNLRLVAHIVKKYDNTKEQNDDLISIGIIGLIKAIDSFIPDKNTKLATYASKCIENEILMNLRKNKHRDAETSLSDTIAYCKDGENLSLLDIVVADETPIDEVLIEKERLHKLEIYFQNLEDREKEIISYRFGLGTYPELTQKEIAKKLAISRSYVSRIEKRALYKLLQEFKKHDDI